MLFYKFFSSLKIVRAMNFLSRQVALEGKVFFPSQKIPTYLIIFNSAYNFSECNR